MREPRTIVLLLVTGSLLATVTWRACAELRPATQATFKVVDDLGEPLAGVTVKMSTFDSWQEGEGFGTDIHKEFRGVTDKEGVASISATSLDGHFTYGTERIEGFYPGGGGYIRFKREDVAGGRWHPWNQEIKITKIRIVNPIPMYAKEVKLVLPFKDEPVGFDLMVGDMVGPHGEGKVADMLFTITEEIPFVSTREPFMGRLTVAFSNPNDGIHAIITPPDETNGFLLPRHAPDDGYAPRLEKRHGRPSAGEPIIPFEREGQNFYIQIRTEIDEEGKLKTAYYARIMGDIVFSTMKSDGGQFLRFTYHLNPTPLDRNMEFDRKQNLFDTVR